MANYYPGDKIEKEVLGRKVEIVLHSEDWCPLEKFYGKFLDKDFDGEISRRFKSPEEVIVWSGRHGEKILFNFRNAVKSLRKDGVSGIEADRLARAEVKRIKDYYADRWWYLCAEVKVPGVKESDYLDDVESDCVDDLMCQFIEMAKDMILKQVKEFVPDFSPLPTA